MPPGARVNRRKGPVKAAWISPGGFFAYEHQWAVTEAFAFHKSIGRTRITNRILDLNGWLIEGLSKMKRVTMHTPSKRDLHAGFVCFEADQIKPEEVGARLRSKGIIASPSPYANPSVRFSAGIVNSEADIERALDCSSLARAAPSMRLQNAPRDVAQCDSAARERPSVDHLSGGEGQSNPHVTQKRGHDEGNSSHGTRNGYSAHLPEPS
ncbi:MAG: aminotransferase class V-fold PLP-dependent enzyme [Acetobacteraceae bacterium]